MNNVEKILENAKKNSIGSEKKDKIIKNIKQISPRLLALLLTLIMSVSLCACTTHNININESGEVSISRTEEYDNYVSGQSYVCLCSDDFVQLLEKYGIDFEESNSVSDYKKIENINELDLIYYYNLLGEEECEKIIQSLGYKNWDDFLIKNNYLDENHQPSIALWRYKSYVAVGESTKESEYIK